MSYSEKIDKFLKPKPIGKGSYEVSTAGEIKKRKDLKPIDEIKNELSYFKSSAREDALNDLDKNIFIESGLSSILSDELVGTFLINPDIISDNLTQLRELCDDEEFVDYLDSLDLRLMQIIPLLENKKEEIIDKRLDYKNFGSYAVDRDIKSEYEKLIEYFDLFITRAQTTREYLQDKKINL